MSEGSLPSGCPCGRSHPTVGPLARRSRKPRDSAGLISALYDQGRTFADADETGRVPLHYAGNCQEPVEMKQNDTGRLFVTLRVRCRKCKACLEARRFHWGRRAERETHAAATAGLRTWFGTLTLNQAMQRELHQRALERWAAGQASSDIPEWWNEPSCDLRFSLVCQELLAEVQRYWKRLRKSRLQFSYLVVFERHKSGLPHAHFLLHEKGGKILKAALQAQWPHGFTNVSIVGGRSRRAAAPEKAAWYVVKYLSKSYQSRQKASLRYGVSRP